MDDRDDNLDYVGADESALALLDLDDDDDDGDFEELDGLVAGIDDDDDDDDDDDEDDLDDDDAVGALRFGRRRRRGRSRGRTRRRRPRLKFKFTNIAKRLARNQRRLAGRNKAIARAVRMQRISMAAKAGSLPQIFLGVDSYQKFPNGVPGGQSATIAVESTEPLRITHFVVGNAHADDFVVSRIQIGRLNLLAGSHPIPASMFTSNFQRPPMETPELPAGTEAKIEVVNRALAPRHFVASFTGIDLTRHRH